MCSVSITHKGPPEKRPPGKITKKGVTYLEDTNGKIFRKVTTKANANVQTKKDCAPRAKGRASPSKGKVIKGKGKGIKGKGKGSKGKAKGIKVIKG